MNFEAQMHHSTAIANALTPTSWYYSLNSPTLERHIILDYPSRIRIPIILDSGVPCSVLNCPTYKKIAENPNITCNDTTLKPSKTLTIAYQTKVLILHCVTLTLITNIEDNSRQFISPFAVVDYKHIVLCIPFFEEYLQKTNIQDFTLHFEQQSKDHPTCIKLPSLLSNDHHISLLYIEATLEHY